MAFDSSTKALLAEATDPLAASLFFDRRNLRPQVRALQGEPMEILIATNALSAIGDGNTFVLSLQGAEPNRASETGTAAM
jgi:hypothetical protein